MRILSCVIAACVAAGVSSAASAGVVTEIEPNDSFSTAQSLDGHFSTGTDPNVANAATTPYVSVISGPAASNADFYKFTVATGGTTGIFDVDFGMPDFDPTLALYDSNHLLLGAWDDFSRPTLEASTGMTLSSITRSRTPAFTIFGWQAGATRMRRAITSSTSRWRAPAVRAPCPSPRPGR